MTKSQYLVEHATLTAIVLESLNHLTRANNETVSAVRDHAPNSSLLALSYRELANAHRNAAEAYDALAHWMEES